MSHIPAEVPIRRAEARAVLPNPDGAVAPVEALRTVVLFTLADAFALVPEEIMWTGYHLDEVLAPLLTVTPHCVPLAVRQEMLERNYSSELARLEGRDQQADHLVWDARAQHANAQDWAAVIMQMVTQCYGLRPLEESAMHGRLVGVLRELGVDHAENPRPARYLPNDVRMRLYHQQG